MPRICFVLCYIGPLPRYFSTFLATCAWNDDVDFLIASDQPAPSDLGANVRWTTTTLEDLRDRFSEAAGFPVSLVSGYKLCDYKPALGQAFANELGEYDFWGFCDPDLVWGHIRSFATQERLAAHDVLTFRGRDFVSGPCTILRNEPRINGLYADSPTLERAFQIPHTVSFTERAGGALGEVTPIEDLVASGRLVSFTDVVRRAVTDGVLRWLDEDEIVEWTPKGHHFVFEWRRGHLYLTWDGKVPGGGEKREVLCYHYVAAKEHPWFYIPDQVHLPDEFRITDHGAFAPSGSDWTGRARFETKRLSSGVPRYARQLRRRVRSRLARPLTASSSS